MSEKPQKSPHDLFRGRDIFRLIKMKVKEIEMREKDEKIRFLKVKKLTWA